MATQDFLIMIHDDIHGDSVGNMAAELRYIPPHRRDFDGAPTCTAFQDPSTDATWNLWDQQGPYRTTRSPGGREPLTDLILGAHTEESYADVRAFLANTRDVTFYTNF